MNGSSNRKAANREAYRPLNLNRTKDARIKCCDVKFKCHFACRRTPGVYLNVNFVVCCLLLLRVYRVLDHRHAYTKPIYIVQFNIMCIKVSFSFEAYM